MSAWLRSIVTIILIVALLWKFDWQNFWPTVNQIHPSTILLVFAIHLIEFPISALKWQYSLRIHGHEFSFGYLLRIVCTGFFFNNFLPSAIGGDAYRVYKTLPVDGRKADAVSAVLLDRVFGLAALLAIGLVGALLVADEFALARIYIGLVVAGGIAASLLLGAIYFGHLKFITRRLRKYEWFDIFDRIWRQLIQPHSGWTGFIFASFLFQIAAILIIYLLLRAVDAPATFATSSLVSASAGLASVLPISINGIGVVEGSITGASVALGIPYNLGLAAAVLLRLLLVAVSLFCGVVYLLSRESKRVPIDTSS